MTRIQSTLFLAAFVALSAVAGPTAGCGGGGIYGGGSGGSTADVRGNIAGVFPDRGDRDIVVFVYRVKDEIPDCTEPDYPDSDDGSQNEKLRDGETEFEVRNIPAGRLIVVFLLDGEGGDADGRIDPGDPIAVLNDPDCVLDDVPNKYIVDLDDVAINFSLSDEDGFPAAGRAEADAITEFPE